jgi:preprotein translocase subunit YajC
MLHILGGIVFVGILYFIIWSHEVGKQMKAYKELEKRISNHK